MAETTTSSKPKKKKFSFTSSSTAAAAVTKPPPTSRPEATAETSVKKEENANATAESNSNSDAGKSSDFELRLARTLVRSMLDQSGQVLDHGYVLTSVQQVELPEAIQTSWREKRRELERRKHFNERYMFYLTPDQVQVADILRNGFKCANSGSDADENSVLEKNVIGSSRCGITLSKHLDVSLLNEYRKRTRKVYCIVVKTLLTNIVQSVCPSKEHYASIKDALWRPNRDFDWTVSKTMPSPSQPIKQRLVSSLAYIYDYKTNDPLPLSTLRNVVPFAVLTYELETPSRFDPTLLAPTDQTSQNESTAENPLKENLEKFRAKAQAKFRSSVQHLLANPSLKCIKLDKDFKPMSDDGQANGHCSPYPGHESDDYFVDASVVVACENLPKSQIMKDLLDSSAPVKFKSFRRMVVKLNDLRTIKNFKYLDEARTRLNVNDSTNKLIFLYQSRRFPTTKKTTTTTTTTKTVNNKSSTSSQTKSVVTAAVKKPPGGGDAQSSVSSKTSVKSEPAGPAPLSMQRVKISIGKECLVDRKELKHQETKPAAAASAKVAKTGAPTVKAASIPLAKPAVKGPPPPPTVPATKPSTTTSTSSVSTKAEKATTTGNASTATLTSKVNKEIEKSSKAQALSMSVAKSAAADIPSLSSELTSLEKRLLRKADLPLKTAAAGQQRATVPALTSSIKLKLDHNPLTSEKPSGEPSVTTAKPRKSFWDREPANDDSAATNDPHHSSDSDYDDVVVVSKRNLNLPPVQYSKQYYDSNISGLESELKKFDFSTNASLSPSPLKPALCANNPLIVTTTTVTKIASKATKTAAQSPAALQKQEQQLKRAQRAGLLLANRQRYMHHIVTAYAATAAAAAGVEATKFDVDNLKYLYDTSVLYSSHLSSNDEEEVPCFEINAGGFKCIHQFRHRRASLLLHNFRRTQSYGAALSGGGGGGSLHDLHGPGGGGIFHSQSSISLAEAASANSNKRISLNDYVSLRARQHSFPLNNNNNGNACSMVKNESFTPDNKDTPSSKMMMSLSFAEYHHVKSENSESSNGGLDDFKPSTKAESRAACRETTAAVKSFRDDSMTSNTNEHSNNNMDDYNSNYDQIEQDTMNELMLATNSNTKSEADDYERTSVAFDLTDNGGESVSSPGSFSKKSKMFKKSSHLDAEDEGGTSQTNQSYEETDELDATLTSESKKSGGKRKKRTSREKTKKTSSKAAKRRRRSTTSSSSSSSSLSLSSDLLSSSSTIAGLTKTAKTDHQDDDDDDDDDNGILSSRSRSLSSSSISLSLSDDAEASDQERKRPPRSKKNAVKRRSTTNHSKSRSKRSKLKRRRRTANDDDDDDLVQDQEEGELHDEDYDDDFGQAELEEELSFKKYKHDETEGTPVTEAPATNAAASVAGNEDSTLVEEPVAPKIAEPSYEKPNAQLPVETAKASNEAVESRPMSNSSVSAKVEQAPKKTETPQLLRNTAAESMGQRARQRQEPLLPAPPYSAPGSGQQQYNHRGNSFNMQNNNNNNHMKKPNAPLYVAPPKMAALNSGGGGLQQHLRSNQPMGGRNHSMKKPMTMNPALDPFPLPNAPFMNNSMPGGGNSKMTPNMSGDGLLGAAPANLLPVSPLASFNSSLPLSTPPLVNKPNKSLPVPKFSDSPFSKIIKEPNFNSPGVALHASNTTPMMMKSNPRNQQHQTPTGAAYATNMNKHNSYSNNNNGVYMPPAGLPSNVAAPLSSNSYSGYPSLPTGSHQHSAASYASSSYDHQDDYYPSSSSGYYADSRSSYYEPEPFYHHPPGPAYDQGYSRPPVHAHHSGGIYGAGRYDGSAGYYGDRVGGKQHFNPNNNNHYNTSQPNNRMSSQWARDGEDGEILD